jgi:ribosomal protein S18 acetylase RimI-like enzyme
LHQTSFDKKNHPKIANFVENKYHKHLGYDFSTKKGFFQTKDSFEYKVFLNVKNIFNIKYATENQFEPLIRILSSIPYFSHYENRKTDLERNKKELKKGEWDSLELPSIEKYLSKKYDGLIMYERDWENIKVYSEKNIKLADGTNTTFDGGNPDIRYADGGEARPFTDDGNKLVVFNEYRNYNPYKIAVDDVNDANYITLWKTDTNTGKDKKVGSLKLNQTPDDFLSVSEISIDRNSKGLGLGLEMYKIALKYSSNKIKGIKSYLPNRSNKRQIPKIYRKLNSVKEGDYEFIYKENNPDISFDGGGGTQPKDLTTINNFENIQKGVDYYSYSDSLEKEEKADRWYELFIKNQKEKIITSEEFKEFISLSNELAWEDLG